MFRIALLTLIAVTCSAASLLAGKYNKVLTVGDNAPAWDKLEGTDGQQHGLADFDGKDVVVVIFTCNSCPVAVDYEERIIAFAKPYEAKESKVGVVAINVNTIKDDQLPAMKTRAEKKGFPFAYLYDPSQDIARKFGANYTPEFFVLNKDRKVVYMGAMDDKSPPGQPTTKHLEAAVAAVLTGNDAPTPETVAAAGCRIRFVMKRDEE